MKSQNAALNQDIYWTRHTERRANLQKNDVGLEPQDFHILGGGVAALAAAYEILNLRPAGQRHTVQIYEASGRVGGRINTRRLGEKPPEGQPDTRPYFERGAMRIPTSHDYTWAYARELGLKRRRFLNDDRSHDFKGDVYKPTDMAALARKYGVRDGEASRGPGHLFAKNVLNPELAALDTAYGGRGVWAKLLLDGNIQRAGLQRIDSLTIEQVLTQRLAADPGQKSLIADFLFPGLLDRAFLMSVRSAITNFGDLYELCQIHPGNIVTGGMDLLTKGLAQKLEELQPGCIQLQRKVVRIATNAQGEWQVDFERGQSLRRAGQKNRHLICTLPFSVLRRGQDIHLVGLESQLAAIRNLSYKPATKVALHVRERFWEPGIRGGRSLSDRPSTSGYYPNERPPETIPAPNEAQSHAPYDLYTQPLSTLSEEEEAAFSAEPAKPGPWLMLTSYSFGDRAERMGKLPPKATVADLKRVFPEIDFEHMVVNEGSETWHWDDQPLAYGAFALPAPRSISSFYRSARQPHGGIFFAGDHLSPEPGWIQGSTYSSLYAVESIQKTLLNQGAPDPPEET